MGKSRDALTERERRFIELYMGRCRGNATQAAVEAGYAKRSAASIASENLKKPKIRRAIEQRIKRDPKVKDRVKLQEFWSSVVDGEGHWILARLRDRLKASELLGRSHAMFTDRHEVEAGDNLLELLRQAGLAGKQGGSNGG